MPQLHVRSFSDPDEVIEANRVRSELVSLFGITVSRDTHMPDWSWSVDVRPVVQTEMCEVLHIGYATSGMLHVVLNDGTEFDIHAGEIYHIPPKHEGWVVGAEPFEVIEWVGFRSWISPLGVFAGRVLATMVLTDIVDSTGTAQKLGDHAWKEMLSLYEGRVEGTLATFGGQQVKKTGDGVLATFDGTARAVRCAIALRAVASQLGLQTRTSILTGEVEMAAGDIHGVAVHEVTRMLDVGEPDEILVSAATKSLTTDQGLVFADRGEHQLRGIEGPRRIYSVGERQA